MKFKKILCLMLCISFAFGSLFVNSVYAEDARKEEALNHCIGLLNALKITEDIDVVGNADRFVTRGEFALLTARFALDDVNTYTGDTVLTDVEGEQAKAAQFVCDMGYLGTNGSVFKPDSFINASDAVKALVKILRYDVIADAKGGTDKNYMEVADDIDITKGVDIYIHDKRLTLSSLVRLYTNALLTPMYKVVGFGRVNVYDEGKTYLEEKFSVYNINGRINANEISGITQGCCAKDHVVIGNEALRVGESNATDYLGYYVSAYYELNNEVRTLIYVDVDSYNEEIEIDAADATYRNRIYEYVVNSRTKKAKIEIDVEVIVNGARIVYDESLMVPREGKITLVNSDKDKQIETVIIENALVGVVANVNASEKKLSLKSGEVIDFKNYDEEYIKIIDQMTNVPKKYEDIAKETVLTIFDNGKSILIYASLMREVGFVTDIDNDDDRVVVRIEDKYVEVSPYYADNRGTTPQYGEEGRFFLDYYGKIAYFKASGEEWLYGYLIYAKGGAPDFEYNYRFKIFSEENSMKTLEAAEKIRINGVSCYGNGQNRSGIDIIEPLKNNPQIIRYRTDSEGKLYSIEYANDDGVGLEKHNDTKNGFLTMQHQNRTFKGIGAISTSAKVFVIPSDTDGDDQQWYRMVNYTYLRNSNTYSVMMYKSDATKMLTDIVVVKRNEVFVEGVKGGVVSKVKKIVDEQGEIKDCITVFDVNGIENQYVSEPGEVFQDIGVNDVVRVLVSDGNNAVICQKLYDYDKDSLYAPYNVDFNNGIAIRKIKALRQEDGFIEINDAEQTKYLNATSAKVIVCDATEGRSRLTVGSVDDIKDAYTYGAGEDIFVQTRYYIADLIVLYKK